MKSLLFCVLLLSLHASAQSPFDGRWKIDLDESQSSTQYTYLLHDGIYHCPTCEPPLEIKADGKEHKVVGDACADSASLRVIDARTTEETDKRNGKLVGTTRMTVSTDGNAATVAGRKVAMLKVTWLREKT